MMAVTVAVHAGSIAFSISFTDDGISITNTGTDAAYLVSQWTLDSKLKWQRVQIQQGNQAYLPPGQSLNGRRFVRAPVTGVGRADPLLLVFFDQAGSRTAQLAWRQPPQVQQFSLDVKRHQGQLEVDPGTANLKNIIASYAFVMPYEGIQQLSKPLTTINELPSSPLRHVWVTGTPMVLNTGAAQAGAWLVHEDASGELHLQIVQDGVMRGQEQVPSWLLGIRLYFMHIAGVLAGAGLIVIAVGFVLRSRKFRPTGHAG